ncbi:MAG: MurR/RpiR family transcriptional regulator [Erysipelotrichaceae bacterium]|nr:MurR/RpiR family transcriptional regulator [Erysipelotrichaceae bacterium]
MFASKVSTFSNQLTGSEQVIARYLLDKYSNGKDNTMMSSTHIARNVGVGQATVVRFSQKLGYPSFKSMMLDIINESFYFGETNIHHDEDVRSTITKLQYQYEQSINDVIRYNSDESINQAVKYMEEADTIFCYGTRTSGSIASIMYYRLVETGCNTHFSSDTYLASSIAYNLKENDVLLVVSVSGESVEPMAIANIARTKKARIISITGSMNNSLSNISDVALKCAEYNVHTNRFNLVNRSSELFLIDTLFIRYWKNNEEKLMDSAVEFSDETTNITTTSMIKDGSYRL